MSVLIKKRRFITQNLDFIHTSVKPMKEGLKVKMGVQLKPDWVSNKSGIHTCYLSVYRVLFKGCINNTLKDGVMIIAANDLKKKGISFVSKLLEKFESVFVSVRGKKKYVILKFEDYERFKDFELENAIREAERDLKEKKFIVETAENHFKRLGI